MTSAKIKKVKLKTAAKIGAKERDQWLGLHDPTWPRAPNDWTIAQSSDGETTHRYVTRLIDSQENDDLPGRVSCLQECLLRFPSAPIYGLNFRTGYQLNLPRINYHTLRLVTRPFGDSPRRISRIYLLHNGLNETDNLQNYYRLAELLFRREEEADSGAHPAVSACLIHPVPGHLTRYPFPGEFAEKPMDRYLADGGELFRQFLRFMVETRWLLSTVTPYQDIRIVTGLSLLAQRIEESAASRLDSKILATAILDEWKSCADASEMARHGYDGIGERIAAPEAIETDVSLLRWLIGWQPSTVWKNRPPLEGDPPFVHSIGYSLGGFLAQSAFFTWPQSIATCTMLNSGGALEGLHISGFAHEEEWQRVLHSLRYAIDSAMIDDWIRVEKGKLAGVQSGLFSEYLRTFYEVFLQEFRGNYQSRVAEYVRRLLFVVGGKDPVVTPRSVMERAPEAGINLVEIANLEHALHEGPADWQEFWLPEIVARVVQMFAARGEKNLNEVLNESWMTPAENQEEKVSKDASRSHLKPEERPDRPLTSEDMQRQANEIIEQLSDGSVWLFIARNSVPEELLGRRFLEASGIAMHFEESQVRSWDVGRLRRGEDLTSRADRVFLVLPSDVESETTEQPPRVPVHPDATGGAGPQHRDWMYADFGEAWCRPAGSEILLYNANDEEVNDGDLSQRLGNAVRSRLRIGEKWPSRFPVNTLPDCWIMVSEMLLKAALGARWTENEGRRSARAGFLEWACALAPQPDGRGTDGPSLAQALQDPTQLRVLKVSRGDFNPRFRGYRVYTPRIANRVIVHTAWTLNQATATRAPRAPQRG